MLHCTVDEKREVFEVQVYALVELGVEAQTEDQPEKSVKPKAKGKGKSKEDSMEIDEDGEESGESGECKTVLCLWKGRMSFSDVSGRLGMGSVFYLDERLDLERK